MAACGAGRPAWEETMDFRLRERERERERERRGWVSGAGKVGGEYRESGAHFRSRARYSWTL